MTKMPVLVSFGHVKERGARTTPSPSCSFKKLKIKFWSKSFSKVQPLTSAKHFQVSWLTLETNLGQTFLSICSEIYQIITINFHFAKSNRLSANPAVPSRKNGKLRQYSFANNITTSRMSSKGVN